MSISTVVKDITIEGFNCCIKKHPYFGHLCGYVHIPKEHPLSGVTPDFICHGGITYSDFEGDNWVLGFDCGHNCDYLPMKPNYASSDPANFKDEEFVTNQLTNIVKQIMEYKHDKG